MNYAQISELFASARNPGAGKPIARNTRILKRGDAYAVRLHKTDILTFSPDGAVRYDTGGWKTVTTKDRMNRFGPARVWSEKGAWYIGNGSQSSPYLDGCIVHPDGMEGVGSADDVTEERRYRAAVAKYAKAYASRLFAGEIGAPGPGDCWGCCMKATDGSRPMGGADHVRSHVAEAYYVPSLAWNALDAMGAGDAYKFALQEFQNGRDPGSWYRNICERTIPRMIRRYVLRESGLSY